MPPCATSTSPPPGNSSLTGTPVSDADGVLTVRYFAGARAAAGGLPSESVPGGVSLDGLTEALVAQHGPALARVLKAASFLVNGVACHDRRVVLPTGATVDILPPFAGG
jgi:molybdopterin synthase sulfur carrier subunit